MRLCTGVLVKPARRVSKGFLEAQGALSAEPCNMLPSTFREVAYELGPLEGTECISVEVHGSVS